MQPKIKTLVEKHLVGMHLDMSIANNKTAVLWRQFSPRIAEIKNRTSKDKISFQVYPSGYHKAFDPNKSFTKWACVEVENLNELPEGMDSLIIANSTYAVFHYKGLNTDTSIYQYIYSQWLPNSDYVLDDRPHFEVLGERYKNNDPESEEEIWIPVLPKVV